MGQDSSSSVEAVPGAASSSSSYFLFFAIMMTPFCDTNPSCEVLEPAWGLCVGDWFSTLLAQDSVRGSPRPRGRGHRGGVVSPLPPCGCGIWRVGMQFPPPPCGM